MPPTLSRALSVTVKRVLPAVAILVALGCSGDRPTLTEAPINDASSVQVAAGNAPQSALDVAISLPADLRGDAPVSARVSVANRSRATVVVPEWQLPSEDLEAAQFVVLRDGRPVSYAGPHIKRGASPAVAMIRVAPGVTFDYEIELSRAYDFSQNGRYTIEFVSRGANGGQVSLRSPLQAFVLGGRGASLTTVGPSAFVGPNSAASITALAALLSYTACTTTQKQQLVTAVASAATYAAQAKSYMVANQLGARYTKWFGTVSTANASKVTANFSAIDNAFATKPITVDCGCKKTYFAYVYPSQPYKIYVCKAFWSARNTGTDSRAGTLVHEMSHFTAVAGTNDWAYGQSAAASLAISNILRAISNADNHEYFAENTPVLP